MGTIKYVVLCVWFFLTVAVFLKVHSYLAYISTAILVESRQHFMVWILFHPCLSIILTLDCFPLFGCNINSVAMNPCNIPPLSRIIIGSNPELSRVCKSGHEFNGGCAFFSCLFLSIIVNFGLLVACGRRL